MADYKQTLRYISFKGMQIKAGALKTLTAILPQFQELTLLDLSFNKNLDAELFSNLMEKVIFEAAVLRLDLSHMDLSDLQIDSLSTKVESLFRRSKMRFTRKP